ncbi:C39 family peptidase [Pseudoclavibacter sp. CFCC 11306]|uniref:C39 family peptidase n=1 Tax=Pseudoclavibacter sp. CFCC 11306 TaxID=1564493 RepID=UPI0017886887|nr:C39 family peptidase [Pseudoclavibacter sp. CFCC 11306]
MTGPLAIEGQWISPWAAFDFGATEIVPSWNLSAPPEATVVVSLEARLDDGTTTGWLPTARWNDLPADITTPSATTRSSESSVASAPTTSQGASLQVDTLTAVAPRRLTAARLKIEIDAPPAGETPAQVVLHLATLSGFAPGKCQHREEIQNHEQGQNHAQAQNHGQSANEQGADASRKPPTAPLAVPVRSQMLHADTHRAVGGGGESWCSPTSMVMLQEFWRGRPLDAETEEHPVPWTALRTYDAAYSRAGNWSFNVAHVGRREADGQGLEALVTRLHSLAEAQTLTDGGIPLAASVSFTSDELPEAGYETDGHLLVIAGFTASGDVVVNDPAAPDDSGVRRTYPRGVFDLAWRRSNRTVYLVHPTDVPLPPSPAHEPAW